MIWISSYLNIWNNDEPWHYCFIHPKRSLTSNKKWRKTVVMSMPVAGRRGRKAVWPVMWVWIKDTVPNSSWRLRLVFSGYFLAVCCAVTLPNVNWLLQSFKKSRAAALWSAHHAPICCLIIPLPFNLTVNASGIIICSWHCFSVKDGVCSVKHLLSALVGASEALQLPGEAVTPSALRPLWFPLPLPWWWNSGHPDFTWHVVLRKESLKRHFCVRCRPQENKLL